jgi:DNA repair protein RecO (recombination protein O)
LSAARASSSTSSAAAARLPVPAFVLHRHDWSESSLILELFTRPHGRIAVIAKGAKRPYSQLRSVLLPFQRLLVQASHKKGEEGAEVQLLRSAEWAGGGAMLSGSALLAGFYLNELLLRGLARHDPHPALFDAYAATLPALAGPSAAEADHEADPDQRLQAALRSFELLLLHALGLLPELDVVTQTQTPVRGTERYELRAPDGLVPLNAHRSAAGEGLAAATLAALQSALQAQDLPALQQATHPALAPLKTQLRHWLHYHLETDRLKTRQVMVEVARLLDPKDLTP